MPDHHRIESLPDAIRILNLYKYRGSEEWHATASRHAASNDGQPDLSKDEAVRIANELVTGE